MTVWHGLWKHLLITTYKLKQRQVWNDKHNWYEFSCEFQEKVEEAGVVAQLVFTYKTTFHLSNRVSHSNMPVLGSQNPQPAWIGLIRSECVSSHFTWQHLWPFLFAEKSINGNIHLELLIKSPQFHEDSISIIAKNKHTWTGMQDYWSSSISYQQHRGEGLGRNKYWKGVSCVTQMECF